MEKTKNAIIHIMNIEAFRLVDIFEIKEDKRFELYSSSLPVSLDLLKLKTLNIPTKMKFYTMNKKAKKLYKGELFNITGDDKIYTDAIINVSFGMDLHKKLDEPEITHKIRKDKVMGRKLVRHESYLGRRLLTIYKLRWKLYQEGFTVKFGDTLVEYVKYKRSSSKAREGSHLFIKKDLINKMDDWRNFGIQYEYGDKDVPLSNIKAYESLTSSGIERIIKIKPEEILLIDDYEAEVTINASVTTIQKDGLHVNDVPDYPTTNKIWDGQSLADTSLFVEEGSSEHKGMMLLRNNFFKSCAFNTKIQDWFNDKLDDSVQELPDMFGRMIKRSDIKLITTPSSLKFLNFSDHPKFKGDKKKCYETWIGAISEDFGVCKSESSSRFGDVHQLSYQLVNSLPLSESDICTIEKNADGSYTYGGLLKTDLMHIEKLNNDMEFFKSYIKLKDPQPSDALMLMLLEVNDKMWFTQMVKDYQKDVVDVYKSVLRKGRIKIENSDYAVLFGNPLEMLQYAIDIDNEIKNGIKPFKRPLKGNEIYCSKYIKLGQGAKLAGFRYPHLTMGNTLVAKNVHHDDFDKYFDLSDNIVISNAYDTDIMDRLQGQDYDSDMILLNSDPIIVRAAEACQNDRFRVPINGITEETAIRDYTHSNEAKMDGTTARNKIGKIINLSQILNSYYWDLYNKNENNQHDETLEGIYSQISCLSSLSQIEIDRAKKDYEIRTTKFINAIAKKLPKRDKSFPRAAITDEEFQDSWIWEGELNEAAMYTRKDSEDKILELVQEQEILNQAKAEAETEEEKEIIDGRLREIEEELENYAFYLSNDDFTDKTKKKINAIYAPSEVSVQLRPEFFRYCERRHPSQGEQFEYSYLDTPMDYLQKVFDEKKIPDRKKRKTNDITEIINEPDFIEANKISRQFKRIIEICSEADVNLRKWRYIQRVTGKPRYPQLREIHDTAVKKLRKLGIIENTIRVVIYRAYSKHTKDKKGSGKKLPAKKGRNFYYEEYGKIKRTLVSCLYKAYPEHFVSIMEDSKDK